MKDLNLRHFFQTYLPLGPKYMRYIIFFYRIISYYETPLWMKSHKVFAVLKRPPPEFHLRANKFKFWIIKKSSFKSPIYNFQLQPNWNSGANFGHILFVYRIQYESINECPLYNGNNKQNIEGGPPSSSLSLSLNCSGTLGHQVTLPSPTDIMSVEPLPSTHKYKTKKNFQKKFSKKIFFSKKKIFKKFSKKFSKNFQKKIKKNFQKKNQKKIRKK